jgi:glutamate synthase domain-containing protein 1
MRRGRCESLQIPIFFHKQELGFRYLNHHTGQESFGSNNNEIREQCERLLEAAIGYYGMRVLGWRDVPTSPGCLGQIALLAEPDIRQVFVDGAGFKDNLLERRLYLARRRAERLVAEKFGERAEDFYIPSLSCRTIAMGHVHGMAVVRVLSELADERIVSAHIVHQRYSTNTLPNWRLAQPFRCIAHNGEINTLSGNRNWMRARETVMSSEVFGDDIRDLLPVMTPQMSDSACFDSVLELLVRRAEHAHSMMMMIPEAFGSKYRISTDKRAYEYHCQLRSLRDGAYRRPPDWRTLTATAGRALVGDHDNLRIASEAGGVTSGKIRKGHQTGAYVLVDIEQGRKSRITKLWQSAEEALSGWMKTD